MKTLQDYKHSPAKTFRDYSQVPLCDVVYPWIDVEDTASASVHNDMASPIFGTAVSAEYSLFRFYGYQHFAGIIQSRKNSQLPLTPNEIVIMDDYEKVLDIETLRMFYYVLFICTRESRHAKEGSNKVKFMDSLSPLLKVFHTNILDGVGKEGTLAELTKSTPNVMLGEFVDSLVMSFYTNTFQSAYGGKKWGDIAKILQSLVYGNITAEVFLDTAFTLSHNTGSIFNKGMMYTGYSSSLTTYLDYQRAGQIPAYLVANKDSLYTTTIDMDEIQKLLGVQFADKVDTNAVVKLGAIDTHETKDAEYADIYDGLINSDVIKKGKLEISLFDSVEVFERLAA